MSLIASVLHLDRKAMQALKINDAYALHKAVYSLFDDVRSPEQKQASDPSGFLYADQGGDYKSRKILLLSDRAPMEKVQGQYGRVHSKQVQPEFLQYDNYRFKVVVNPTRRNNVTRKLVPFKDREAILTWFAKRTEQSWGFKAASGQLQVDSVDVLQFKNKSQHIITLAQAHVQGVLKVTDRQQFIQSFSQGVGRGRAFGCGLLQIAPVLDNPLA